MGTKNDLRDLEQKQHRLEGVAATLDALAEAAAMDAFSITRQTPALFSLLADTCDEAAEALEELVAYALKAEAEKAAQGAAGGPS